MLPHDRVEVLDVLRGFALFGIFWVNIDASFRPPWHTWYDHIFYRLDDLLADGRFYPQFALLFGLGFSLQMLRASRDSVSAVSIHIRRMVILFVFGLLHFILLFEGDILRTYAVAGVALLAFRRCPQRLLLLFAALGIWWCVSGASFASSTWVRLSNSAPTRRISPQQADAARVDQQAREEMDIWDKANGHYTRIVATRARRTVASIGRWQFYTDESMIWTLSIFLLGLYAGREGWFQNAAKHRPVFLRLLCVGLALGLTARLVWILGWELASRNRFYFESLNPRYLSKLSQLMAVAYIAAIALLFQSQRWRRYLLPLASAGRMALSNYIFQSLIASLLFYGYGLGLFVHSSAALNMALAIAMYSAQVVFSRWWLRYFQFGPLEWVWRTCTYGRVVSFRAAMPRSAPAAI